jgi:hypothetical protein
VVFEVIFNGCLPKIGSSPQSDLVVSGIASARTSVMSREFFFGMGIVRSELEGGPNQDSKKDR